MSTWDQIRSEVRSFRASIQPTVTTIRDFTFDSRRDRIYFLASDLAKSSKSPMLFYVDLPHVFTEADDSALVGTTTDNDDIEIDASDEEEETEEETEDEEDEEDEDNKRSDGDLTMVLVDDGGAVVPRARRIRGRSSRRPPPKEQQNDNDNDEDLDLVPFDPNTYQFVELTHPPRFLPSVVGSYPREATPIPSTPPPPPKTYSQMDQDPPSATIEATNDAVIDDILRAAPVLEWQPVLSEEWIKEHHAAYLLSRNDVHHRQGDSGLPSRIAPGITQYQFEPQLNRLLFPYGDEIYLADIPERGKIHPEPVVPHCYPGSCESRESPSSSLVLQQPISPSVYFISGASPVQSPKSAARIPISTSVSSIASTAATSTSHEDHLEGTGGSGLGATAATAATAASGGGGAGACHGHLRMDPKLGGTGLNLIAFTRTRDLWVMTTSGIETQLTFCSRNKSNTAISCGIAEFIMHEEFHRDTNYYWAPQPSCLSSLSSFTTLSSSTNRTATATTASSSTCSVNSITSTGSSHRYHCSHHHHHHHLNAPLPVVTPQGLQTRPKERILYLQVSEAMVDVVTIPRQGIHPEVEEYRYPHAGTPNAASDIQIVEFVAKQHEDDIVPEPLHKRLWGRSSIYKICPWLEYIVRFGWTPNGDSVWAQVLDRRQQTSALVMIPLDCFQSVTEHANSTPQTEEELASRIKIIFEEQSEYWINVTDILYIFPSSDLCHSTSASATTATTTTSATCSNGFDETTQCIVASERTGFRHLYLLTYDPMSGSSVVPITAGDYQVVDKPISVDLHRRLVYFTAKRDTVLETHLYVASFAKGADPQRHVKRLTHLGYSHQVTMDGDRTTATTTASSPTSAPRHDRFLTLFSSMEQSPTCAVIYLRWDKCKVRKRARRSLLHPTGPYQHYYQKQRRQQQDQGQSNEKGATSHQQENKRTRLASDDSSSSSSSTRSSRGGGVATTTKATDESLIYEWCDCGCQLPKISSYALLLREGIRNLSAKEVRDHPVVPPPPRENPSETGASSSEVVLGRSVFDRFVSGQDGGAHRMNGTTTTALATTATGLNPGDGSQGNNSNNNLSNGTTSVRPRKSLSGFLASHLLSPGILQSTKFPGNAFSSSDSTLVLGGGSSSSSSPSSSLRARTKSAPRLGGVFSSSGSAHVPSSPSSSSGFSASSMGGRAGGGGGGGGASTSPPSSCSSTASGIGTAVNANHHPAGEFFTFESSDKVLLHGCLYRPAGYVPGTKYPTLVSIYGGPKSQMVTNEYKLPKFLRVFLATRMGYAVVMFDGRGSNERGIEFEGRLRHRMGQVEIQDQVEGLQFLARPENGGIVDMDRVAITGWSYGGYLSLMALVQYPEVFKLAIAGAPVTKWELYNSAYTERYMGLLSENKEGYSKSNVLSWIDKFPDSENRLLIAHGLIDENVHFKNTETLSAELIRANKPHHIQIYPTERHGLRDARVNEHFETLMFYWLRKYL
ncbi:dipeptidylpeptidase [Actinomortierella ambigua]|nr:dipeptidylpeptidase [Actinomortierella ambigua]